MKLPNIPAMIIEFKRNKSTGSAIRQIREGKYSLSHYQGDLMFAGVNYDEDTSTHTCRIERFVK